MVSHGTLFHEYKDYDTYFKAARKVLEVRNDVTFLAIGAGDKSSFKIEMKEYKSIIILDKIQCIEEYSNIFTLSVLTTNSNIYAEGISNFIMESMALKKPVLATNDSGTPELVEDNITGFLIEPFNYKQLADNIILLLDSPDKLVSFGNNARKKIEDGFTMERMNIEYKNMYLELV